MRLNGLQLAKELLRQIKGMDIVICEDCKKDLPIQIHHNDKNYLNNNYKNLSLLCRDCHLKAHHGNFQRNSSSNELIIYPRGFNLILKETINIKDKIKKKKKYQNRNEKEIMLEMYNTQKVFMSIVRVEDLLKKLHIDKDKYNKLNKTKIDI